MKGTPRCNLCHNELFSKLLNITKPDRFELSVGIEPEGYTRTWYDCDHCHSVVNIMSREDKRKLETIADNYYEIDFKNSSLSEKFDTIMSLPEGQSDNTARAHRILETIKTLNWSSNSLLTALDIGSGTGVFPAKFLEITHDDDRTQDQRWEITTLEPDPKASQHLRSLDLFKVLEKSFPCDSLSSGYNLITLNKVLEHIERPIEFLRDLGSHLDGENGVIYIEVPDKGTIDYRPPDDNILGSLHVNLYDITSLSWLVNRAGLIPFKVVKFFEPSGKISVAAFAIDKNSQEHQLQGI